MVVIRRTQGGSYLLGKLDGSLSKLWYAAFWLIPSMPSDIRCISVTKLLDIPQEELEEIIYDSGNPLDVENMEKYVKRRKSDDNCNSTVPYLKDAWFERYYYLRKVLYNHHNIQKSDSSPRLPIFFQNSTTNSSSGFSFKIWSKFFFKVQWSQRTNLGLTYKRFTKPIII